MFNKKQYQLLDFGDGRRLERFGEFVLDRRCKAVDGLQKSAPQLWQQADAVYGGRGPGEGTWKSKRKIPLAWPIHYGKLSFELKLTEFGHVGVFPEHATNWDWIARQVKANGEPTKVLNLFAYTGGATMAAAAAGAEVVHVDAAQNTVLWARRNTGAAGLGGATIRWITEDATKFAAREIKRGNKYHGIVLDPPSYGHGPKGEVWKIEDHLPELLELCAELTAEDRRFVLLSCHKTGYQLDDLKRLLTDAMPELSRDKIEVGGLAVATESGRQLPGGIAARWTAH